MAPGPQLGVLLGGLDLAALTGFDLVEVLRARARQLAHEQARLLATMAEIGLCDPGAGPDEVARLAQAGAGEGSLVSPADEIRAALAWTRTAADREYHFALTLRDRLPAVFAALDAGMICRSKAWLFAELCAELTEEQAQVVCDRLLAQAGRLTTGELAARIKKLAIALDPEWAARRYASAVRDRDVIGYLDEDGTATVTGRRLPAEQAAAACARIEELARAAKRGGYPGRVGPLRADIYLGLLDGRWQHRTREEILADLLAAATPEERPEDRSQDPTPGGASDRVPAAETPADTAPAAAGPEVDTAAASEGAASETGAAGESAEAGKRGSDAQQRADRLRVGVELRVGLATLLGRDRHPGEIPGWGPVTAETARTIAAAQRGGEWRYAITDAQGQLLLGGLTRHRPTPPPGAPTSSSGAASRCRGGIVELHIPASLLSELAAHPEACGPWTAVVADLTAQYRTCPTEGDGGASGQDPAARFAGAVLRRHVQLRDRFCVFRGCRCPARHAELDHTVDHARGGRTTAGNSGPLCPHDHWLKHVGGWRLTQPEPGHFTWISPLGKAYHTRPQPITFDLPDPLPRPEQYPDGPPGPDDEGPILWRPPTRPDPPRPPPRVVDPDEPAPF
jgi:hypothetical protein